MRNREKQAVYMKVWRKRNIAKVKADYAVYYAARRERLLAAMKVYRDLPEHKARNKELKLLYNYGLSVVEWKHLFVSQGSRCALCKQKKPLEVDHDHRTDKVRGLLCQDCNTSLGKLGDTIERLQEVIVYLEKTK